MSRKEKKQDDIKRLRKTYIILIILISILMISSALGMYAWSKYVTLGSDEATAQVAKWHFDLKLKAGNQIVQAGTESLNLATTEYNHVVNGKIAPGTSGEFQILIDTTGTEVNVQYYVDMKLNNCPRNIVFSRKAPGEQNATVISSGGADTHTREIKFDKYLSIKPTNEVNGVHTETIYWSWPYDATEAGSLLSGETYDAWDTADMGMDVTLSISATAMQKIKPDAKAEEILVINNNNSPYVTYVDGNGNEMLCRVLYNDSTHGLQLITANPVREVVYAKNDPNYTEGTDIEKAQNSYNNLIVNLNNYAEEYINTNLATDARCVGSKPTASNGVFTNKDDNGGQYVPSYTYLQTKNYLNTDSNYEEDITRMNEIGVVAINDNSYGNSYLLASLHVDDSNNGWISFGVRVVDGVRWDSFSPDVATTVWMADIYGYTYPSGCLNSLRPVFLLKSGLEVTGGNGTFEEPFILGE